ncbi:MAG: hypothetical protein U0974_01695 [Gemmatimonadales bacterium]|nr:hypothetical protein [Gemmatimonadales bacterium]MDZ4388430.1 hypothetical protein [Gemmatimonadales bacterium]
MTRNCGLIFSSDRSDHLGSGILAAVGVIACAIIISTPAIGTSQATTTRKVIATTPVLERTIGEKDEVTLFQPNGLVALSADQVTLFDWSEMQLRTFSVRTGQEIWTFGRRGEGPEEFKGAHDLIRGWDGTVTVLDKVNDRVTRVSAMGQFLSSNRLQFPVRQLLPPLRGSVLIGIPEDTLHLWAAIDQSGTIMESRRLPREIHYSSNLAGESYTTTVSGGVAIAFRWSDVVVVLDSIGGIQRIIHGPERVEFPSTKSYAMDPKRVKLPDPKITIKSITGTRIDPAAIPGAQDIAGAEGQLFVLFNGAGPMAGRLVDQFDIVTGTYLGTHVLPHTALSIAALDGRRIATLESEVVPVVRVWRLPDVRSPRRPPEGRDP